MKQKHLRKRERVNLGSYYTPRTCVNIVENLLAPHVDENTVVLDNACGYGSFLGNTLGGKTIGVDVDGYAVATARRLHPNSTVLHRNALIDVRRESLGISNTLRLAVVGNPPYNDHTSQIRRTIKQKPYEMDRDLRKRDLGLSFLMSYSKLRADVICVLHPLFVSHKADELQSFEGFQGILSTPGRYFDKQQRVRRKTPRPLIFLSS